MKRSSTQPASLKSDEDRSRQSPSGPTSLQFGHAKRTQPRQRRYQERRTRMCRSDGAWDFYARMFYKDVAPLALAGSAGFSLASLSEGR